MYDGTHRRWTRQPREPQKGDLVRIKVGPTTLSKIGLVIKHDPATNHLWVKWPDKTRWESPNFLKVIEL
jgi:hypothetical protein